MGGTGALKHRDNFEPLLQQGLAASEKTPRCGPAQMVSKHLPLHCVGNALNTYPSQLNKRVCARLEQPFPLLFSCSVLFLL